MTLSSLYTWYLFISVCQKNNRAGRRTCSIHVTCSFNNLVSLASHHSFSSVLLALPITSRIPHTEALSSPRQTRLSYAANDMCSQCKYDAQQVTAVQLEASVASPANFFFFRFKCPKVTVFKSFFRAHFISYVCVCTCPSTPINLVCLSGRFALDRARLWSLLY